MKNKSISTAKLLAATLAGLLLIALVVFAFPSKANAQEADTGATDASVEFTGGLLTLGGTPKLNFGQQTISNTTANYAAESVSEPIVVSDLRGSGAGWHLLLSLSEFKASEKATLKDSYITITDSQIAPLNGTVSTAPTADESIVLYSDNVSVKVLNAAKDTGLGVWQDTWLPASTVLTVLPGTAELGVNTALMNWSLEDTP